MRCSQRGFSMVEMMISITIGLMLIGALTGVLISNSRSGKTNERTSELQANGRYALDHLRTELRHAGFRGYTWGVKVEQLRVDAGVGGVAGECLESGAAAGSFIGNLRQSVWGANDSNPFLANCLASAPLRGDVLVIRRVAGVPLTSPAILVGGSHYLRSTYTEAVMFAATAGQLATQDNPSVSGMPIADFLVQEYVYYLGVSDSDASLPALRRKSLVGGVMVDEEVISGVEQFQVQFSRMGTDLRTEYFDPDGIVGGATAGGFTDWEEVVAVRIWLLARNSQPEAGYSNTTTYTMGDVNYVVNDHFRRQLFTTVVQLRNTD
jgi:type IV pilus assembly protein PilW